MESEGEGGVDAYRAAVRPNTRLLYAETPANPKLDLVDLDEVGAITGATTVVDSTFATPLGQNPLAHGVDLVLHSATKGIAGHNDATIGVVAGTQDLMSWLWGFAVLHGANASPLDGFNAQRGLRTLGVRLAHQAATAQRLAEYLDGHDGVELVRYPGLDSHPQRELAVRQMHTSGGLLTFDLRGDIDTGCRFTEAVRLARQAPSLGGPETLISHPASTTHHRMDATALGAAGISEGLIRLSVGLEDAEDLLQDLEGALRASQKI